MSKIKKIAKNKYIWIAVIAIVLISAFVWYAFGRGGAKDPVSVVVRGDAISEVSVTGKTVARQSVSLSFEQSGTLKQLLRNVGDRVKSGDVIARLDSSELLLQLRQMDAATLSEQAKLNALIRGTRPEEIQVSETKVKNAEDSLADARTSLKNAVNSSYTSADDAVRNKVDLLMINSRSSNPQLAFALSDSALAGKISSERAAIESMLVDWKNKISDGGDTSSYVKLTQNNLDSINAFLDDVGFAVNSLVENAPLSSATISSYKTSVSGARTEINTAISSLASADGAVATALSAYSLASDQLKLDEAGSDPEQISAQQSSVKQAEAKADQIRVTIGKMSIRAPFAGIVTTEDAKVGQIAVPNVPVVSIMTDDDLKIEAQVSEVDVGSLQAGDDVAITLDAFPGKIFSGKVSYIDPAETIIDGVVNYKTTVEFSEKPENIKSGLTANLKIKTDEKKNVLLIPQSAIIEKDAGSFVEKIVGGKKEEVMITTGIRGKGGQVEITAGLSEGDTVVDIGRKN